MNMVYTCIACDLTLPIWKFILTYDVFEGPKWQLERRGEQKAIKKFFVEKNLAYIPITT